MNQLRVQEFYQLFLRLYVMVFMLRFEQQNYNSQSRLMQADDERSGEQGDLSIYLDILSGVQEEQDKKGTNVKEDESSSYVCRSKINCSIQEYSGQKEYYDNDSTIERYWRDVYRNHLDRKKTVKNFAQSLKDIAKIQQHKDQHFEYQLLIVKYLAFQSYKGRFKYIAKHFFDQTCMKRNQSKGTIQYLRLKVEKGEEIVKDATSAANEAKALWEKGQQEVMQWILNIVKGILELEGAGIFHADLAIRNSIKVNRVYKIIDFDLAFKVKLTKDQSKKGVCAFEHTKVLLQFLLDNPSKDNYLINNYIFRDTTQEYQYCPLQKILQIKNDTSKIDKVQELVKLLQNYSLLYHRVQFKAIIQEILNAKKCTINKERSQFILNAASKINQRGNITTIKDYILQKIEAKKSSSKKDSIILHENKQIQFGQVNIADDLDESSQVETNTDEMPQQVLSDQSFRSEDSQQRSKDRCSFHLINYAAKDAILLKNFQYLEINALNQAKFQNGLFLFRYLSSKRRKFKYIAKHYFVKRTLKIDIISNKYLQYDQIYEKGKQQLTFLQQSKHDIMIKIDSRGKKYVFHWVICLIRAILELQEAGISCDSLHRHYIRTAKYHFKITNFNDWSCKVANYSNQRADQALLLITKNLIKFKLNWGQPKINRFDKQSEDLEDIEQSVFNIKNSAKSENAKIQELMELQHIYSLFHHKAQLKLILKRIFSYIEQSLRVQIKGKVDSINVTDKQKNREGYEQLIAIFKKLCSKCKQPDCVCRE